MELMMTREKWNDNRLDDFKEKVGTDIRELRGEMNQRFDKVEGTMESGMKELRGDMGSLKKSLLAASVTVIVTLIACCASLVGVAVH